MDGLIILSIVVIITLIALPYVFDTESRGVESTRDGSPNDFIQLEEGVTHYQVLGSDNTGPVVVFVPGATLPLWVWQDLPLWFSEKYGTVITYDLFGRGRSDRPKVDYDLDFHYRQLRELVMRLAPGRSIKFISLAFGTLIAADYARRHPDEVLGLVAIGPDGFGVNMSKGTGSWIMRTPGIREYFFSIVGTKMLMARLDDYTHDEKVLKSLREYYRPELNIRGFKRAVSSSVWHMPIHDATEIYRDLTATKIDTCLIWGDQDRVTPMPHVEVIRQVLPSARIEVIEGCGHLPHWEQPHSVQRILAAGANDSPEC